MNTSMHTSRELDLAVTKVSVSVDEGTSLSLRVDRSDAQDDCGCGKDHGAFYQVLITEFPEEARDGVASMIADGELLAEDRMDFVHEVFDGISLTLDIDQLAQIAVPLMHALAKFDPERLAVALDAMNVVAE